MKQVVFYFQVHQPYRLREYSYFDIGHDHRYFDDELNEEVVKRVAQKCYVPMNRVLLEQIRAHEGRFRFAMSISGTAIHQMENWAPEALDSFRALVDTGCVELLSETYYHSLSALYDEDEFAAQVAQHRRTVEGIFGVTPRVFRNTELIYSNHIAWRVQQLGFAGMMAEGADHVLNGRSPGEVYSAHGSGLPLLLRSYQLSDDIAFRFSNRGWQEHPLTSEKFADWVRAQRDTDQVVGLFMDYETFGEHQWEDTGIFDFMRHLPGSLLGQGNCGFMTPSEALATHAPRGEIDSHDPLSWADVERDLSAWLGNSMQRAATDALYDLAGLAHEAAARGRPELLKAWRLLTTSDHVYYMATKDHSDAEVHNYFSHRETPHDSYIAFMSVLGDLRRQLAQ